jgi:hypothetical protein
MEALPYSMTRFGSSPEDRRLPELGIHLQETDCDLVQDLVIREACVGVIPDPIDSSNRHLQPENYFLPLIIHGQPYFGVLASNDLELNRPGRGHLLGDLFGGQLTRHVGPEPRCRKYA